MVPVQGKITFGGKAWPKEGMLYFLPVEAPAGVSKRPGAALFDREGNFRAGSFGKGDGLLPGRYKITVECWEVAPSMEGPPAKSYVPAKYQNAATSDLELTAVAGAPQTGVVLDVPMP